MSLFFLASLPILLTGTLLLVFKVLAESVVPHILLLPVADVSTGHCDANAQNSVWRRKDGRLNSKQVAKKSPALLLLARLGGHSATQLFGKISSAATCQTFLASALLSGAKTASGCRLNTLQIFLTFR
jgi:hypothetical protein